VAALALAVARGGGGDREMDHDRAVTVGRRWMSPPRHLGVIVAVL
jgi:hypothetical protein